MRKYIIEKFILFCSKKALGYDQRKKMLLEQQKSFELIYCIGLNVLKRDIWIKRIIKLQKLVNR